MKIIDKYLDWYMKCFMSRVNTQNLPPKLREKYGRGPTYVEPNWNIISIPAKILVMSGTLLGLFGCFLLGLIYFAILSNNPLIGSIGLGAIFSSILFIKFYKVDDED